MASDYSDEIAGEADDGTSEQVIFDSLSFIQTALAARINLIRQE